MTGACGPDCDCGAPAGGKRARTAIGLAVLCAVAAILGYKAFSARQASATAGAVDFGMAAAFAGGSGRSLDSFADLNRFAMDQDAVFVFVPDKRGASISETSKAAIMSAQRTLKEKGLRVAVFALKNSSPDYAGISARIPVPALLVLSRGKGMAVVSGEATEEKVMQAFVASSRAGSCGPGMAGCAPGACR